MKTIKEVIDDSNAIGKKLFEETPGLSSLSFEFFDFPVADVRDMAKYYKTEAEYNKLFKRFRFMADYDAPYFIYIHILSTPVKMVEVIEEI